ncbi:MAG TPA: NERD domain-containing protein [Ktedonobacteraceae bacterium]|jgi:hypothetical protein
MATMYPQYLPASGKSDAERKLFRLLQDHLPPDYTVIWSIDWTMARSPEVGGGAHESEIDFLILHPAQGILVIEVKGGGVGYDGTRHEWYTIDRNSMRHTIKDPFEQARDGKYALIRELTQRVPGDELRSACRQAVFGHAIVFPDIEASRVASRPGRPEDILLDRYAVQSGAVQAAVEQAYRFWRRDHSQDLGNAALSEIVKLYAPSWYIRPPMILQLVEEETQLKKLTEQQFIVLSFLQRQKRVGISGCAGSGKTFLAVEQARRLARRGLRVLLTCYNRNLANWLRAQITEEAQQENISGTIDVFNFHRVASRFCAQVGMTLPVDESRDYDVTFAESLLKASVSISERYDAIIADEGQDFAESWWIALLSLLHDQDESPFVLFYDDNQRIYGRRSRYPVPEDHHYSLTINCRTTQKIHQKVVQYYSADELPTCMGPVGREIEQLAIISKTQAERQALGLLLQRLTRQERIPLDHLVLLSPIGKDTSRFRDGGTIGPFRLHWQMDGPVRRNALLCCSIFAFKGLERAVVILAEMDRIPLAARAEYEQLVYVALSRAKQHLILLGHLPQPEG